MDDADRKFELHKLELEHRFQSAKFDREQALEKEKLDREHLFESRKEYARQVLEYALQFDRHLKEYGQLYQIPEGVTRLGFPNQCRSDSRWRTKEVRHVDSDTIATGF